MPEPATMIAGGALVLVLPLARRYFETAKEVFDVLLGCVALILSLPVLILCALVIKLSSRGPVLYRQTRAGRGGKLFRMYKLRTMFVDAESAAGAVWAKAGDSRIVPGCWRMRRSHVDELPQLLNVINGDMSLVGPRPERPEILDELAKVYPDSKKRPQVTPGITGLAQVRNGYDGSLGASRRKLEADLEYIERRKWRMELRTRGGTLKKLKDKGRVDRAVALARPHIQRKA